MEISTHLPVVDSQKDVVTPCRIPRSWRGCRDPFDLPMTALGPSIKLMTTLTDAAKRLVRQQDLESFVVASRTSPYSQSSGWLVACTPRIRNIGAAETRFPS